jgi:hypothetical protein
METTAVYDINSSKKKDGKSNRQTKKQNETSISEPNNHENLKKTFSNIQKAKKIVKDRLIVWNCCFCPHLQSIDCCNSCEVDIQSHIGV